ncbi:ChrR family anti-sigma-E factor [Pseudocolwellia sp. HL-MZ19]|uniref:ChrR family anti-sigma-E factor n=1 Tax=Pseudocolwellia sp. HL-MZ19 TaxID=3400846 RepID=UPI003CE96332
MITHHPQYELLNAFVEGVLPASLSAGIAVHAEMCEICAKNIERITEEAAANTFSEDASIYNSLSGKVITNKAVSNDSTFDLMMKSIMEDNSISEMITQEPLDIEIKGTTYPLPTALRSMSMMGWQKLGKLSRARIDLNEGSLHTSLLHIDKDGGVPSHTHKGFELTLLLEGTFEDEKGTYVKGDFIWLTDKDTHTPHTKEGCLCYTVADDALQFTQGLSKLLNPIGMFIY